MLGPLKVGPSDAPRKTTGIETIGDRTYTVIEASSATHLERLYFDVQTSLLYKQYDETRTPLGVTPSETIFEDYRDVSGQTMPFQIVGRSPNDRSKYTFSEIQINQPIDPASFEPPPVASGKK